jgi:hypothetical protein
MRSPTEQQIHAAVKRVASDGLTIQQVRDAYGRPVDARSLVEIARRAATGEEFYTSSGVKLDLWPDIKIKFKIALSLFLLFTIGVAVWGFMR